MNFQQKRPYRKKLSSSGLISINGQPQIVTIKNISITGALAELHNFTNKDNVLAALSESTSLEIQIPDLQLTGEAEIIRIETKQPPAKAGGFELRTESPDTRRLNDASNRVPF